MATHAHSMGAKRPHARRPAKVLTEGNSQNFWDLDVGPVGNRRRFASISHTLSPAEIDRVAFFVANAALAAAFFVLFVLA